MTNRTHYPTPEEVRAITLAAQRARSQALARLVKDALAALRSVLARVDPRAQPSR